MRNWYSEDGNLFDNFNRQITPRQLLGIDNPLPYPQSNSPAMPAEMPQLPFRRPSVMDNGLPRPPMADIREIGEMRPNGSIFNDENSFTEAGPPSDEFINNLTNHLNQFPEDLPSILEDYGAKDEMPPNILQQPAHDYFNNIPLKPWNQYQGGSNRAPEMYIPTMQEMTPTLQESAPMLGLLNRIMELEKSGRTRQ